MQSYSFTARVEDGRLKVGLQALQMLRSAVSGWRKCPVVVTVERQHATRSVAANAYYWAVVVALFLPKRLAMCGRNGELQEELVIGGSTTKLNKIEFYEYVERVREFAREKRGLIIPGPDPSWREEAA